MVGFGAAVKAEKSDAPRLLGGAAGRLVRRSQAERLKRCENKIPAATYSPTRKPCSTIGSEGLNFRVRDGNGWDPFDKATGKLFERARLVKAAAGSADAQVG